MIKLGSIATDKATGLKGMPTHLYIEMNNTRMYNFQPRGLNEETGQPIERFWLVEERLVGGERVAEPELPTAVLGTEVEDEASGFTGVATAITLHISGCVHVTVQPPGRIKKTGERIKADDFDIRRLKGKAVPKIDEQAREKDQARRPSPAAVRPYEPGA